MAPDRPLPSYYNAAAQVRTQNRDHCSWGSLVFTCFGDVWLHQGFLRAISLGQKRWCASVQQVGPTQYTPKASHTALLPTSLAPVRVSDVACLLCLWTACACRGQDMLCLLTVWFRYGNDPELHRILQAGFNLVRYGPVSPFLKLLAHHDRSAKDRQCHREGL